MKIMIKGKRIAFNDIIKCSNKSERVLIRAKLESGASHFKKFGFY